MPFGCGVDGALPVKEPPPPAANAPTVSVVISAWKREAFWREAVRSALDQSTPADEVVVVKTAGPDDDARPGENVRIVVVPESLSIGGMYAEALGRASGRVIAFLDDDDRFKPSKVQAVKAAFLQEPGLALYRHELIPVGPDGTTPLVEWYRNRKPVDSYTRIDPFAPDAYPTWLRVAQRMRYCISTMAVRRSVLEQYLPILPQMVGSTDNFLTLAAMSQGTLVFDPEAHVLTRVHPANTSRENLNAPSLQEFVRAHRNLESLLPYVESGSPLVRAVARDYRAEHIVNRALMLGQMPTPHEWREYGLYVARNMRPYRAAEGLLGFYRAVRSKVQRGSAAVY
jgi:glycosyltransferase involved in cell wall biosynthesis